MKKSQIEAAQKDLLSNISWANGFVLNGQKIIDPEKLLNEQTYNILESLRKEWEKVVILYKRKTDTGRTNTLCQASSCFTSWSIWSCSVPIIMNERNSLSLLFALIVLFPVLSSIMVERTMSVFIWFHFAMIPIIVRIFP